MLCPQDNWYTHASVVPGNSCTDNGDYSQCTSTGDNPTCCPSNMNQVSTQKCTLRSGFTGVKFTCIGKPIDMTETQQINCCLSQNLPNNTPNGYCKPQWCEGTDTCNSFLTGYCKGDNLNSAGCIQFCKKNPGKCDPALLKYCANPINFQMEICGCALPNDQYYFNQVKLENDVTIATACDKRCGNTPDAIRLEGQEDCKVDAICVIDINDNDQANLQKELGNNIKINQNCGSNRPNDTGFLKKYWYILVIIIILIIIMVIFIVVHNSHKNE